jgi:hypothetical protein
MSYEPLPIEITQNGGHHYRQIWRDEHAAVYEQPNAFGALLGYEAIAIKRQEACRAFGRQYQAKELYPCSEDWGKLAVSVSDVDRAMDAAREFSSTAARRQSTHLKGPDSSQLSAGGIILTGIDAPRRVAMKEAPQETIEQDAKELCR